MGEYLYHYTSLETLKLILENKTIRFRNLSLMDDLEEGDTVDLEDFKKFVFISSWTDDPSESNEFWQYTGGDNGVRIRIKKNPFKVESFSFSNKEFGELNNRPIESSPALKNYFVKSLELVFLPGQPELFEVTYTGNEDLLKPEVIQRLPDGHFNIYTKSIGIFKSKEWATQKEWRYRLRAFPREAMSDYRNRKFQDREEFFRELNNSDSLDHVDLPLRDDAFEDLEILISPFTDDDGEKEIKELVEKYVPHASVENAKMKIRRR